MRLHQKFLNTIVLLIGLMLAACSGGGQTPSSGGASSRATSDSSTVTEATGDGEAAEANRTVIFSKVEGEVQFSQNTQGDLTPAQKEQPIVPGSNIQTGASGKATLELEDGTRVQLEENTHMEVIQLEGTPDAPVSKFRLHDGKAYAFHQGAFPRGASFDIETVNGTASIQHSMMSVEFDKDTGKLRMTCLEGSCSLTLGEKNVALEGGQIIEITGPGVTLDQGLVQTMTQGDLQDWVQANLDCSCEFDIQLISQQTGTPSGEEGTEPPVSTPDGGTPGGGGGGGGGGDETPPPPGSYCGDGTCDAGEDSGTCSADCGSASPFCGDANCNGGETSDTCPGDCGSSSPFCGDLNCNGGEDSVSCPGDCGP